MTRFFRHFKRANGGNVAMMFGIITVPLLVVVGGAVDYNGAQTTVTRVQNAADHAALVAARYSGSDQQERKRQADAFFLHNIPAGVNIVKKELVTSGREHSYKVKIRYEPTFLRFLQIDQLTVDVKAVAAVPEKPLDVVMVLDSSGSMAHGNRMVELKKAVKLFLQNFAGGGKTQVALVAFDTQVRVSNAVMTSDAVGNAANPYDSNTDCSRIADSRDRDACYAAQKTATPDINCARLKTGHVNASFDAEMCSPTRAGFKIGTKAAYSFSTDDDDTYEYTSAIEDERIRIRRWLVDCDGGGYRRGRVCTDYNRPKQQVVVYDEPKPARSGPTPTGSKPNSTETANNDLLLTSGDSWSGCVVDRTQNYDVSDAPPTSSNKDTLYPKANCAINTLLAVRPLSNKFTEIASDVDALKPSGNTNLTIGVQWGMEAFSPTWPLTGQQVDAKKVMIILTDGENTQNRWWGWQQRSAIDERSRLACANTKAKGIEVYTVRLMGGNETLLKNCASSEAHYHPVTSADRLSDVFARIASEVKNIRLIY